MKSRKINYDFCLVHFLSDRRAILSSFLPKNRKIILVTYGSDILRKTNFHNLFFKKMLDNAYKIVFTTGNIEYTFKMNYGDRYAKKCIKIGFPCASFKLLDLNIQSFSKNYAKRNLNFPLNKYIITCGHTSTRDEQYEKIIQSLACLDKNVLEECFFVFMMTYGSLDYQKYQDEIEFLLLKNNINGVVLKKFLSFDEMSMIHIASDIHITAIKTDALSFFMLEELFCGSKVLYGEWLHYIEFEKTNLPTLSFPNFDSFNESFCEILHNRFDIDGKSTKQIIEDMNSNNIIKQDWDKLLRTEE